MSHTREELEKTGMKQPEPSAELSMKAKYIREQLERAFLPVGRKEQKCPTKHKYPGKKHCTEKQLKQSQ